MKSIILFHFILLVALNATAYEHIYFLKQEAKVYSATLSPAKGEIVGSASDERVLGISNNSPELRFPI